MEEPIHVGETLSVDKWESYSEEDVGRSVLVLVEFFRLRFDIYAAGHVMHVCLGRYAQNKAREVCIVL